MRKLLFGAIAAALLSAGAVSAQGNPDITIAPSDESPLAYYALGAIGIIAPVAASILTARMSHGKNMAELQLQHATQIQERVQEKMEAWMKAELAQKEHEIEELRQRCDELENNQKALESKLQASELEKQNLKQRYQRLLQEYNRLKAVLEGYRLKGSPP